MKRLILIALLCVSLFMPVEGGEFVQVGGKALPTDSSSASTANVRSPPVRVAVFSGTGVGASAKKLIGALGAAGDAEFDVTRLNGDQIRAGELRNVDVLVFPGGSGSRQAKSLGKDGRHAVRSFVRGGGGYLGVCAGAYLATNDYEWSLKLIDARVVDRRHWARGTGMVTLQLSPRGSRFFQTEQTLDLHYAQGPLLARREWDDPETPDYESLAIFATEIAKKGAPQGVMVGTSAAVRCQFGSGRVFCFSPHPESTDGQQRLIPLAVHWLVDKTPRHESSENLSPEDPQPANNSNKSKRAGNEHVPG